MKKELEKIQNLIYRDLADLYGVELRSLNQSVRRNNERFPSDFMFQLTQDEWDSLRSQFVISKSGRGGRRYAPFVFTEHGILMLSTVLNSSRAIEINIHIMRVFVKLRLYTLSQPDINAQVIELRKLLMLHIENTDKKLTEHDEAISQIIRALNNLIEQPPKTKKIGFGVNEKAPEYSATVKTSKRKN